VKFDTQSIDEKCGSTRHRIPATSAFKRSGKMIGVVAAVVVVIVDIIDDRKVITMTEFAK
jgi:hypothetical protein